MLASFLQTSNFFTQLIQHISRCTNYILDCACCVGSQKIGKTIENWHLCRTTIITFSGNSKYLGFANTAHINAKDRYSKAFQKYLDQYLKTGDSDEAGQYLLNNLKIGIGKPITNMHISF